MDSTRRHGFMPLRAILCTIILFLATTANAAVLGIDFGTQHIKAVLVKPGRPFDIVLTKDSKRKEVAAVAFKPVKDGAQSGSFPERSYGADAIALQGRFPGEVFPNLKPLLGLSDSQEDQLQTTVYHARYPGVEITSLTNPTIKSKAFHESDEPWTIEELVAMELANVRRNAESQAGSACESAVITVPGFYTAHERAAITRAAELAGLNVMGLVSDGLAVGLDYAKSRTFPSISKGGKSEHHLIYDMGAGSTTATLLRFQGRDVKDIGKFNKTIQEVSVVGVGWDRYLGGDALTQIVVSDYVNKFLTKPVIKSRGIQFEELQENGRAMSRLWKDAEKARSVLSANSETTSSFEELLPDIDFKSKLTRTEFEAFAESYAGRVSKPAEDALAAAGLKIKDIDSIILHGGAVRTPFVQRQLEKFAGGTTKLKTNVNADESAVHGAALKAAILSPSFKVKEIRSSDTAGYVSGITYLDGDKQRSQTIFYPTSPVGNNGTTKQISLKTKDDFTLQLWQKINDDETPFAEILTQNLTASVKALKDQFSCDKENVDVNFSLRLSPESGILEAVLATASCETDSAVKSSVGDSVKDWFGLGKKKDQAALDDEEEPGTTEKVVADATSSSAAAASSSAKVPEKPKKRIETINIAFTTTLLRQPSPEDVKKSIDRLAAFDKSDTARLGRDEAANVLESYTYWVKDFLVNTDYSAYSTEAQRNAISKILQSTRDFMDQPAEVAKATEKVFRDKLAAVKDLVTPILNRRAENEGRPEKLSALQASLDQAQSFIGLIGEQMEKAKEAASSSIAKASASASSLAEKIVKPSGDDLDELEEPVETAAAEEEPSSFSNTITTYTEEELASIQKVYDDVKAWLAGKDAEQKKVKLFEDPAFTIKDLEKQAALLSDATTKLLMKKIRTPPRSTSKKAKTSKTKAPKKGKATESAESSSVTSAPEEGEESFLSKANYMTVTAGEEMPSEDEILQMIKEAQDAGSTKRDEL